MIPPHLPARGRRVGRTRPDPDGVSYPLVGTGDCNCGWGYPHEPGCGVDIDDSREYRTNRRQEATS